MTEKKQKIKRELASYSANVQIGYASRSGLYDTLAILFKTPNIKIEGSLQDIEIKTANNPNQCCVTVRVTYGRCFGSWRSDIVARVNAALERAGCKASFELSFEERTVHMKRDLDETTFWTENEGYLPEVIPNLPPRSNDMKEWKAWYENGGKFLRKKIAA